MVKTRLLLFAKQKTSVQVLEIIEFAIWLMTHKGIKLTK